jgi:hypothetical protein
MKKTFTLLLLLFASLFLAPNISFAKIISEVSNYDTRYGDKDIVKFYPNPMTTDATVKISEEIDLERSKVSIVFYNIVGSEVYKVSQIKDYEQKITKENFKNAGIYFYQLKIDEKIITTGRVTVK